MRLSDTYVAVNICKAEMETWQHSRLYLLVSQTDHRRSQDFVCGGALFYHPAKTPKIDSCSGWGVHLVSCGGALTHFSRKLGLKKIFFTALGGCRCTHCTPPWLRLWNRLNTGRPFSGPHQTPWLSTYCKTLFFHRILISRFPHVENSLHFNLADFPVNFVKDFVCCFFWCL